MTNEKDMQTAGAVHICSGGEWDVLPVAAPGDVVIGVDAGALRLLEHGITPTLAVGDFDTIGPGGVARLKAAGVPMRVFPAMKDATDTQIALEAALAYRPQEIVLYGALGGRLDHALANVQLLWTAHQAGVRARIESRQNRVTLLSDRFPAIVVERDRFRYISLLPLTPQVTGVTLDGFLYPLTDATLVIGSSLGVSNQLAADCGRIVIVSGALLVIQSCDTC